MKDWIGQIAGIIWNVLQEMPEQKMELILLESHVSEADPNMTNFEFFLALGWLLREGKIHIHSEHAMKVVTLL